MVTAVRVAEPSVGIRTEVVGAMPTTSVWIPVYGSQLRQELPLNLMCKADG